MPWSAVGNLRGPQGLPGPAGRGIASSTVNAGGELIVNYTDGTQANLGVVKGAPGADGTSVTIHGTVANAAALPTNLTSSQKGRGYLTDDDGHLHVWDGTTFTDVGVIRGPRGPAGVGEQGPRGATWFTGNGVPGTIAGSQPGDKYVDMLTGDVYALG